jgi:hypothetical protein
MGVAGAGAGTIFGGKKAFAPNGAPSALTAVPYSGTRIDVFWTNGSTNEDSFNIYGSTDGVNFSVYDTAVAGATSQNITGLTQVADYWFYVTAVKGSQESTPSNTIQAFTYATLLFDGNTVMWLKYEDLTTITKDESENVTEWRDCLGSDNKIASAGAPAVYTEEGIRFYYNDLLGGVFTAPLGANWTFYFIIKIHSIRDGTGFIYAADGSISFTTVAGGTIRVISPPGGIVVDVPYSLDLISVMRGSRNAAFSGYIDINGTIEAEYIGQGNPTGIQLHGQGLPTSFVGFSIKEVIVRKAYEAPAETSIYDYLVKKKL